MLWKDRLLGKGEKDPLLRALSGGEKHARCFDIIKTSFVKFRKSGARTCLDQRQGILSVNN